MKRIRTLDGWRGVAILFVVVNHAATTYAPQPVAVFGLPVPFLLLHLGGFGVDIFFVLSGLIITARLLKEREQPGTLSLRRFYLRRAFRIMPVVLLYLGVLYLMARGVPASGVSRGDILGSLFFVQNYRAWHNPVSLWTAHFWTLSIEEQFYLFWPGLFLLLGRRRAFYAALAGAGACAAWRTADLRTAAMTHLHWVHPAGVVEVPIRTDVRCDGLLLGAALAVLLTHPRFRKSMEALPPWLAPAAFLAALACIWAWFPLPSLLTYAFVAAALVLSVHARPGLTHRVLNTRPLVWIGNISFSLYVWQQLFLLHPPGTLPLNRLNLLPWNIVASFGMAALSYYAMERPLIRYSHRLTSKR